MRTTKKDLIEFIKDNLYINRYGKPDWNWNEDVGSKSSEEINKKVKELLKNE